MGWHDEQHRTRGESSFRFSDHRGARGGAIDVHALLSTAVHRPNTVQAQAAVAALVGAGLDGRVWSEAAADLLMSLEALYEHGWQPADLMHVIGKKLDPAGQLLIGWIIRHDAGIRAGDRCAPGEWSDQVRAVDIAHDPPPDGDPGDVRWVIADRCGLVDGWRGLIDALGMMVRLPPLQVLMEPPSRWPRRGAGRSETGCPADRHRSSPAGAGSQPGAGAGRGTHNPKMLARIRALLAKAESTDFPEEAEALAGKAQSLMSRYAIDEAVVGGASAAWPAAGSDVRARRVHVDSPYASAKVQLLAAVGAANRVRVIWLGHVDIATVVGFPLELDLVEMLYTSLLVQATRAMTEAGRASPGDRSKSFRRAFLLAYAHRIGERLSRADADETADATRRTTGVEVVLARRSQEVDEEFDRLFPRSRKMRTTRVDARGWHAGRNAADRASIARGRLDSGTGP